MNPTVSRPLLVAGLPAIVAVCTILAARAAAADQTLALPDHGPNVLSQWHVLAAATITGSNPAGVPAATPEETAPTYDLDMATVHVAMYDALAIVTNRYKPFRANPAALPAGATLPQDYAVHGAACAALGILFPSRRATYQPTCDAAVGGASSAELAAYGFGGQVAQQVLAWRANDGRLTALPPFENGTQPGQFRNLGTPPVPVNRTRPYVLPFSISHVAQFRAEGPPALGSAEYAADVVEARTLGSATSTVRTEVQTTNARFHTMPPPLFWTSNLLQFATSQPTLVENARLMAALWVGHADAITGCFESKYHFLAWRPVHAIRFADTDGNPATDPADAGWTPVVPTPNHPEYPAAHSCGTGATAEILNLVFGTRKLRFTFVSTVTGTRQEYESTDAMDSTIQQARIAGGMHFRTATVHGRVLGMKVAKQLMREHFQPVR